MRHEFWSFVQHGRSAGTTNATPQERLHGMIWSVDQWPAFWQQRSAMLGADQYSFHSPAAERVLNAVLERRDGQDYDIHDVTVT